MSEANILNPNAASLFNPDWNFHFQDQSVYGAFRPSSGRPWKRLLDGRGQVFDVQWNKRPKTTALALQQWDRQNRNGFFSFYHAEFARYFSGSFNGTVSFNPVGNDQYNISAQFEEYCGVPLYAYPGENSLLTTAPTWLSSGMFIEERNDFGEDNVKLAGTWTYEGIVDGNRHGGGQYVSTTLDSTAEWRYFGYGFRLWSYKDSDRGIVEVLLDGVHLANVDLYNAALVASAPCYVKFDVVLGTHRVTLRCTHTKNAGSSNYAVNVDALEVMR
jgi:hypothetical protein